jgi:hypothetical protein
MKSDSLPFLACILVGSLALTPVAVTQTTTTITATPNPAAAGAQIDLTGTVQPNLTWTARPIPIPTGTITFVDGTAPLNATPIPVAPATVCRRYVSAGFREH